MRLALALCLLGTPAAADGLPPHAVDVARHVLLHELAHGLIREFDIPLTGNEEVAADAFATLALPRIYEEGAERIVTAYAAQQARDHVDRGIGTPWSEHPPDLWRAHRAACLLHGADPARFGAVADWAGLDEDTRADCSDTAPDQQAGWERLLAPHVRAAGAPSPNVEVIHGEGPMTEAAVASGLMEEIAEVARAFDWPEPVVLHFDHCDGTASWSRTERRVLLCDAYLERFAEAPPPGPSLAAIWRRD